MVPARPRGVSALRHGAAGVHPLAGWQTGHGGQGV